MTNTKRFMFLMAIVMLLSTLSAFGFDIPSFDAKKPHGPEDPSLILAGIGGLGIGISYLRGKLRK